MNDLNKFIGKIEETLELSSDDIRDFRIAADHDIKCKCELCKKYHLIIKGKYKSKNK